MVPSSSARDDPDPRSALAAAGLRVTGPRLAVLAAVEALPHSPADTILARVRATDTVSTQAVYDVLHTLTRSGLLRRIEPAGAPMLYETRVGDNHHHLVCRSCGAVADVPCESDAVPCARPSDERGFDIDEAEITFWGHCAACSGRDTANGSDSTRAHGATSERATTTQGDA